MSEQTLVSGLSDVNLPPVSSRKAKISVAILLFVNFVNYMDRISVSAILEDISTTICEPDNPEVRCSNDEEGLIQTALVIVYFAVAPIFGYLGDRYSRKYIMAFGVFVWGALSFTSSFMPSYWSFLCLRASIAIGESGYSTIAPTVLGDLFSEETRSVVFGIFYLAIPLGSALGYGAASIVTQWAGDWRWGLRVTPGLNLVATILIIFFLADPPRGHSEGHNKESPKSTWLGDLNYIFKIKSFMLNVFGFTCVTFMTGALSFWGPDYIKKGIKVYEIDNPGLQSPVNPDNVSIIFGAILAISGCTGVITGMVLSKYLRPRFPRIDSLICGISLTLSVPLLMIGVFLCEKQIILAFVILTFGQIFLNMNWSVAVDMTIYVILPTRRSTAEAIHLMASHAFGEAGSPYFTGLLAQGLKDGINSDHPEWSNTTYILNSTIPTYPPKVEFLALQQSFMLAFAVLSLGAIMFLISAIWIATDKNAVDEVANEESKYDNEAKEETNQKED